MNQMKQNIAVIGCGYWGKNLIRNFQELGALHTVCDTDAKALEEVASRYPQANAESEYRRVLLNDEIKGVVIATPVALHYSMAKEALLAGKDVFVEKPLALKVEEGRELVRLAEEGKRVLLVGLLLQYHPAVVKLKELVDKGELGKIQYIYSNRLNLGKFRTEENIMWSFAPHDVSAVLLLMGDEMPQKISTHGGYYLQHDIADVTLTTMDFRDGVRSHIFVSWLHPYKEQKLVVVGNKKMALFDDTNPKDKLFLYGHEIEWVERKPVPLRKEAEVVEVSAEEPLRIECQDFLKCIENRSQPKVDGNKGLQVLEIISHCQESMEGSGRIIFLTKRDVEASIHETSVIEQPCQIGEGTKIWHFSHLMPHVTIGKNCTIGQNVFIGQGVTIGNNVKMENNVSVFEGVKLEDDVFCGPSCVFTNVINPRSHVSRKNEFKPTLVKKGATVGANATIICGHTIGRYAFIGAGSVVTKNVPDHALVYGDPAQIRGWVCRCGVKLQEKGGEARCPECGQAYKLAGQRCSPLSEGEER
jgi:UDP-2-acetamido-3-amino-2,3-dideoxy-glucuronate N-acetyltransferase